MKTMKKKKLAVIGIAGMLYSAMPASAQTFYQCMPIKCKAGEYLSGGKCLQCPANTYCEDNRKIPCPSNTYSNAGATSCHVCPAGSYCDSNGIHKCAYGTYSLAGNLQCVECAKKVYYKGPGGCNNRGNLWTKLELSVGGGGCTCSRSGHLTTSSNTCGSYVSHSSGLYGLNSYYQSVILLSCDRTTGQTYFFQAQGDDGKEGFKYYGKDSGGGYAIEHCQNNPKTCAYTKSSNGTVLMIKE